MDYQEQIIYWLGQDDMRMEALERASSLKLNDWCLAAGFVRNMVWDKLHDYEVPTPLNDIDLIYFDPEDATDEKEYEQRLKSLSILPWSVKNQTKMHIRNGDHPYSSTADAMSYWVEVETAVGVKLESGKIELVAPFGLEALMSKTISINKKRVKKDAFRERMTRKKWLEIWPDLKITD